MKLFKRKRYLNYCKNCESCKAYENILICGFMKNQFKIIMEVRKKDGCNIDIQHN